MPLHRSVCDHCVRISILDNDSRLFETLLNVARADAIITKRVGVRRIVLAWSDRDPSIFSLFLVHNRWRLRLERLVHVENRREVLIFDLNQIAGFLSYRL